MTDQQLGRADLAGFEQPQLLGGGGESELLVGHDILPVE